LTLIRAFCASKDGQHGPRRHLAKNFFHAANAVALVKFPASKSNQSAQRARGLRIAQKISTMKKCLFYRHFCIMRIFFEKIPLAKLFRHAVAPPIVASARRR
jgi:hypothetical protein